MLKLQIVTGLTLSWMLAGCASQAEMQANAHAVAMQDDSICRGYGAKPGTPTYVQCRMNIANQRAAADNVDEINQAALARAVVFGR